MDADRRKEIIATQKPEIPWANEPTMGAYYGPEEFEAVRAEMERCNHPHIGFHAHNETALEFEAKFAEWCGAPHALAVNGAGSGLDLAVMALDLEPGDEVIVPAINFKAAALSVLGQGGGGGAVDERTFQADPADVRHGSPTAPGDLPRAHERDGRADRRTRDRGRTNPRTARWVTATRRQLVRLRAGVGQGVGLRLQLPR